MNVLDIFSGIGGFSLGLERAGMRTVAFCELEPFCRRVLAKHWPHTPCYDDIRELTANRLRADGIAVDVIAGGFPCQDISVAGKGAGIEGERSGLWSEYRRLIGELRPRYVIVENVSALLNRGLERVLRDLAALGYDAEWHCIPASAVGAPHRRDRVWIVAYPGRERGEWRGSERGGQEAAGARNRAARSGQHALDVADANSPRRREQWWGVTIREELASPERGSWWRAEPNVGRVAHGVPARVDRLRSLGNAVVPQIPEIIGKAIIGR